MARNQLIQVRRDAEANWVSAQAAALPNAILAQGEFGYAIDTKILKVGDGSTLWGDLPAVTAGTLSTSLSTTLGGTGSIYGAAPAFSYYTINSSPSITAATVTAATGASGTVTYTAANNFLPGHVVTITGLGTASGSSLNLSSVTVATATSTQFTVSTATVGVSSGSGLATLQSSTAPRHLAYTWTGAAGTNGSFTTTDDVKVFGKGAALLANTAYDIDMLISYQLTVSANCTPRLSFTASNGLTFQTGGIDVGMLMYYSTSADTTLVTNTKAEFWFTGNALTNQQLTPTTTTLTTTTPLWYLKTWVKGTIRTNAAGTFTPTINVSAGTSTISQMLDGSYIKLTPIGTGTSAPTTIGTWA